MNVQVGAELEGVLDLLGVEDDVGVTGKELAKLGHVGDGDHLELLDAGFLKGEFKWGGGKKT